MDVWRTASPFWGVGVYGHDAVRRVQRALNAADRTGLPATGVVAADTWALLRSGRR